MRALPPKARALLDNALAGRLDPAPGSALADAARELRRHDAALGPVLAAMREAAPSESDFEHVAAQLLAAVLHWMANDRRGWIEAPRSALARAERAEARIGALLGELESLLDRQRHELGAAGAWPADRFERLRLVREARAMPGGATVHPVGHASASLRQATAARVVNFMAAIGEAVALTTGTERSIGKVRAILADGPPAPQWAAAVNVAKGDRLRAIGLTDEHLAALAGVALSSAEITADAISKHRVRHLAELAGYRRE